ncbi:MAG: leucyl aminopeptidase family protein [Leptolyngbya sp. SIO4C1]|nr:leucyl aminopeptidase family protein [Leptolyngbya sp. SIO4C1]
MTQSVPIYFVDDARLQSEHRDSAAWQAASGFKAKPGTYCLIPGSLIPGSDGALAKVLVGQPETLDTWALGSLSRSLPPQTYRLADTFSAAEATQLCLGWQLGQYQFRRYKQEAPEPLPTLALPETVDRAYLTAATEATYLVRDLINTPTSDLGTPELEAAARNLAAAHQAEIAVTVGTDLLSDNYPMIYAVGKANIHPPRLIDLRWGEPGAPKVTLVGKGVCFDSGGLNMKSATGMKLMKKDMGGAAQVLGLAKLIMQMTLPVRLRLLIPAVENSVSGEAMRPLDVLTSRKGTTVEVGNTDAEGRLVLADALWEASSEQPDLLIDCATLTGAARIAVGTELPAFFCSDDAIAAALKQAGNQLDDPLWQLPLYQPYRAMLDSTVADINNVSNASYGGAITAALFLKEFTQPDLTWIHLDFMAYNLRSQPGRPEGGEAMGMRALFELIRQRFAQP